MLLRFHRHKPKSKFFVVTALLSVALLHAACTGSRQETGKELSGEWLDSISNVYEERGELDSLLILADDLEGDGTISHIRASRLRAHYYSLKKQTRTSEYYLQEVLESDIRSEDDLLDYFFSASDISNHLVNRGNFEGALNAAIPAATKMEKMKRDKGLSYGTLMESIGRCQVGLGHKEEAAATYDKAFHCYQEYAREDTTASGLKHLIINAHNTALSYLSTEYFSEARFWTERMDSILNLYESHPSHSDGFARQVKALVFLQRATALQGLGQEKEAAQAYQAFQRTAYGQTPDGDIDATRYLVAARRFSEAANNYQQLDGVLASWGYDLSFNNVQRFLFPKYRANVGAGRKDSAIAVGFQILDALDAAIVQFKNDEAAELAVIYDMQGKQMQIEKNRASLILHRLVAVILVLVLLMAFFVIYSLYRKRALHKLAVAHQQLAEKNVQLEVANAKAEESSQMKTHFIQQISHEIRTPLNILSGFTQVITTPGMELDDETRASINRQITENTDRITGLVNKMLELSDATSKAVIERTDQVSAVQIAAQAVDNSGIAMASHLVFDLQVTQEAEPLMVNTNLKAATRVLTLLLDNARKFTKPAEAYGPVAITEEKECVWLRIDCDKEMQTVRFLVEDTGKAIPAEEAEHVFEEFVQLDQYYDGTGIGLTVARSLARRLGGDVVLDTSYRVPTPAETPDGGAEERGARFIMTLPAS